MRLEGSQLLLSATDLSAHLGCRHLTGLERLRAEGRISPPSWRDPNAEVLRERGLAHERAYIEYLRAEKGLEIVDLREAGLDERGIARTREAMRDGVAAIAQAPLVDGRWRGRADILLRVGVPSMLGAWSYLPADTKLAFETRGGTVLQLCLYAEVVDQIQGLLPEAILVVAPGRYDEPDRLRTRDYIAYYRLVRAQLEAAVDAQSAAAPEGLGTYPEPVPQCDTCRWWKSCDERWRKDDHLSLVAGISRLQREELVGRGVASLTGLATAQLPLEPPPARGSKEGYERAHRQARIQLESRRQGRPQIELLDPIEDGLGLARLPEPSPGDVFLDLEGDPFVENGGLEYLIGWVTVGPDGSRYRAEWAFSRDGEKAAFEALMDDLAARWERHPGFHVYHFAPYEPAALKRLMGRHATREEELDRLLRAERFVDLHAVVRQGLRVGVEAYGLKQLEPAHGFERELDLRDASLYKHALERALELGNPSAIDAAEREAVEVYNRDDCVSTWRLREWLEQVRADRVAAGVSVPRPAHKEGEAPEALDERTQRLRELAEQLTRDVPPEPEERSPEQSARWILAHLLEWHRREEKACWWEFFRLAALPPEGLRDEKLGLVDLEFVETVGGTAACPIHRYRFPAQDHDIRPGQNLYEDAETQIGTIESVDAGACTVDVKKRRIAAASHPRAVFAHERVRPDPLPVAIERLAHWVADNGIGAPGPYRAARDLLLKRRPRLAERSDGPLARPGESSRDGACRLALSLDEGVLPVQGPPGTGKTHTGARVITELVRAGKRVGITAVSHKVIRNLLEEVLRAAREEGTDVRCIQKVGEASENPPEGLRETRRNEDVDRALANGEAQVAAGTAWLWAREAAVQTLDVLVVDEAGQLSLANALAAAGAARNVVLLGDPQQLEQPIQGSHPEGCDASALEHLLEGRDTIPDDRGLFLPETWRLHPSVCRFTSELFYDGRLEPRPGCERQQIIGSCRFAGAGLWLAPVEHEGNQTSSPEEVECVAALVEELTGDGVAWVDAEGIRKALTLGDVLVVSPYNAQVAALRARLPAAARVGTVDKFQGQEAPVVLYSMATSSVSEAPRGLEFLFSLHRLNVATSRARCACILVASPHLLEAECRTPRQMRLANALCRYRELARPVALRDPRGAPSGPQPTVRLNQAPPR